MLCPSTISKIWRQIKPKCASRPGQHGSFKALKNITKSDRNLLSPEKLRKLSQTRGNYQLPKACSFCCEPEFSRTKAAKNLLQVN